MIRIETPAPRRNMRYNDVVLWLKENGFSRFEIRRLVRKGVIEGNYIKPYGNRKWYNAQQITEALDGEQNKEKPK